MTPGSDDMDPRVAQANERTLLAWLRTGIGLMAFGFVVARSSSWVSALTGSAATEGGAFAWLGIAVIGLGTVFSVLAGVEYARIRRAILERRPVSTRGSLALLLVGLVALAGLVMAVLLASRAV
jgi:putative membrane protein